MKFNFLQGDFSGGELSPRAQGHVESDAYKAGLRRAANVVPTRTGSIASRAGLKALLEGVDAHLAALDLPAESNSPVQHIDVHDGPYGDFVIEVSSSGLRLMDKSGVLPLDFPPTSEFVQFTAQDGMYAYGDAATRTVYLRSDTPTPRSYYLTRGGNIALVAIANYYVAGLLLPTFSDGSWIFSGKIAGDAVTAHIVQSNAAHFQDIAIAPDADGNFSVTFSPNVGGAYEDFYIQLVTAAGTTATTIWDIGLTKQGVTTSVDTVVTTMVLPSGVTTPLSRFGSGIVLGKERVRGAAFWAHDDFWVALAGGPNNCYAGFALRWHTLSDVDPLSSTKRGWTFGTLPCTKNSLAKIVGANAVSVFQDRVWYGVNLANGKHVIRASVVGYGRLWGYAPQAGSAGDTSISPTSWLFQFTVETETFTAPAFSGVTDYTNAYKFPAVGAKAILRITVDGKVRNFADPATALTAGHEFDYSVSDPENNQDVAPGGVVTWHVDHGGVPAALWRLADGASISITRGALADDPLDLNLASPSGRIAWLNVLRGLVLGTTRNEKLFQRGVSLSIDPATGQSFDIEDESSYGSDVSLPALDINDKVLFVQQGRRVLRYAGLSITTNGGLVSEDVGVVGEHLTKARVRSLCFLKSPVPRVVMAFDDGTGAVMSVLTDRRVAFSRLTIPACFGGIYNVAALNSEEDSELWVGTENGVTLWAASFESDIQQKELVSPVVYPWASTHLKYDTETPLPPVMDGWQRLPLVHIGGGVTYVSGLPGCAVGQSAWALVNGQLLGPYAVEAGGVVHIPGLDTTWVDAAGARRAQEVYVGLQFTEHRFTTLPLEGGNPVGSSQALTSRKPQLYLRLVDSYLPMVNGTRMEERGADDAMDALGARVTDDRRATEEGFQRGGVVDVVMDVPLRMEISAVHGGVVMNNI